MFVVNYEVTNTVIHRLSRESSSFTANQAIQFQPSATLFLFWTRIIHSRLTILFLKAILISFYLHLGFQNGLFPWDMCAFLLSLLRITCSSHFIHLYLITVVLFVEYKSWSLSLWSFLQSPLTPSFLSRNVFLTATFSNVLSPCFDASVRDHILQAYETNAELQIWIF